MVMTGGRSASDIIHARRGTTPPHVEKARLRAETAGRAAPKKPSRRGFRNYWSTLWHDAWNDAEAHHGRARQEKRAGTRPTRAQRMRRLGETIWRGYGDPPALPTQAPQAVVGSDR